MALLPQTVGPSLSPPMEQRRNPQRLSPQGGHVAGIPVKIAVAVEAATESGAFELGSVDIEVFLREPCELGDETG